MKKLIEEFFNQEKRPETSIVILPSGFGKFLDFSYFSYHNNTLPLKSRILIQDCNQSYSPFSAGNCCNSTSWEFR